MSSRSLLCIRLRLPLGLLVVCFTISLHLLLLLVFSSWESSRLLRSLSRPLHRASLAHVLVAGPGEVVLPHLLVLALLLEFSLPELLLNILLVRLHDLDAGKLTQVIELELSVALASALGIALSGAASSMSRAGGTGVRGPTHAFARLAS